MPLEVLQAVAFVESRWTQLRRGVQASGLPSGRKDALEALTAPERDHELQPPAFEKLRVRQGDLRK